MPAANSRSNRPGWYLVPNDEGFRLHLCVSGQALSAVRRQIHASLGTLAEADTIATAQLLMTELLTNALEACGPQTPVVVVVRARGTYVELVVHDPDAAHVPSSDTAMPKPDALAVSGRGLPLVQALGAGPVLAKVTDLGKRISCRIPNPTA